MLHYQNPVPLSNPKTHFYDAHPRDAAFRRIAAALRASDRRPAALTAALTGGREVY